MTDEKRTELTFRVAERLVDDDLVTLVTESAQQNTDLDMCGARHAVMARNIAEDVLEHLLNVGWLPPDEAKPLLALAEQPTPLVSTPIELTQEQVEELRAEFKAVQQGPYVMTVLPADPPAAAVPSWRVGDDPGVDRDLLVDAAQYVIDGRHAAQSAVKRNIRVGFAKAGQLLDLLETWGVVGPARGSMAREVLVPKEQLAGVLAAIKGDANA